MDLDKGMAETVAPEMPTPAEIASCKWLPDEELRVYVGEYESATASRADCSPIEWDRRPGSTPACRCFPRETIDQPSMFIAGRSDWGAYQNPGALERMQKAACTRA